MGGCSAVGNCQSALQCCTSLIGSSQRRNFKLSNYWDDGELKDAAGGDSMAYLDIYQIHYYDNSMGKDYPLNVFNFAADELLDNSQQNARPLLLGEIRVS